MKYVMLIFQGTAGARAGGVRHRRRPVATRRRPSNPPAWLMTALALRTLGGWERR